MTEVRGRLEQSLHNSVWLALGLERQDYQVQRPWSATVAEGAKRAVPLDAGTRIVEVFDRPDLQKQSLTKAAAPDNPAAPAPKPATRNYATTAPVAPALPSSPHSAAFPGMPPALD